MGEKYVFQSSSDAEAFEKEIAELVAKDESGVSVANPERFHLFRTAFEMVRSCFEGEDVKVDFRMNEPYPSSSYIFIEGKNVTTKDAGTLMRAMRMASNIDIYPMTNGKVHIDLGFDGMTRKVQ